MIDQRVNTVAGAGDGSEEGQKRLPQLDGVRGVAVLLVMVLHFFGNIDTQSGFERAVAKVASYGLWGVDLFFVLSGFLITGILYDSKGSSGYFKNFYMRRTLRIFPLYYGVLLVLLVLVPSIVAETFVPPGLSEAGRVQSWLWSYAANFYVFRSGDFSIPYLSHFWSLAIEEHFYLFWPFVIGLLPRAAALRVSVIAAAVALVTRIVLSFDGYNATQLSVLTPCRLDALCVGAFFALETRGRSPLLPHLARRAFWSVAFAILVLSAWHAGTGRWMEVTLELRTSLLAVFFGLGIYLLARPEGLPRVQVVLTSRWLRVLGKYSYGLYVYHGIISYDFHMRRIEARLTETLGSHAFAVAAQAALGLALSMLVAVTSYELFESRFLRLKQRFQPRPASAEELASANPAPLGRTVS
jgi:peptidoglycan/LPS O-acetylase OafA/YrhL